jgi:putative acetyltransferase
VKVRRGSVGDSDHAVAIWRAAVDATHQFLRPEDRAEIDATVSEFFPQAELWMVDDGAAQERRPVGFLIMDGEMIDALFVHPDVHGRGFGTALVRQALTLAPRAIVDANEQATNALLFYEARGFVRIGRSQTDQQGRPYPLVHLRYAAGD